MKVVSFSLLLVCRFFVFLLRFWFSLSLAWFYEFYPFKIIIKFSMGIFIGSKPKMLAFSFFAKEIEWVKSIGSAGKQTRMN
jgi:hypothetical protein